MSILDELFQIIKDRASADPQTSYVASLYNKGTEKIAQKVGEEAIESVIEAIKGDPEKLKEESADLLFHLMILWADQGIAPQDVFAILEARFGTSGHDEKKGRTQ
jgi:phosphoribosyl-ATP pyrophosphohydrolase